MRWFWLFMERRRGSIIKINYYALVCDLPWLIKPEVLITIYMHTPKRQITFKWVQHQKETEHNRAHWGQNIAEWSKNWKQNTTTNHLPNLFCLNFSLFALHRPWRKTWVASPGSGTAAARAALPIPISVCSICRLSRQWYGCQCSGFLTCTQLLMHAIAHRRLYGHRKGVCTGSRLWAKNPLPHRGLEPASVLRSCQSPSPCGLLTTGWSTFGKTRNFFTEFCPPTQWPQCWKLR